MGLNNSKIEDFTSKMETNTPEPHSNTNKIIISVVCVVVMIVTVVIGIIGFAFYKKLCKNTGNLKLFKICFLRAILRAISSALFN